MNKITPTYCSLYKNSFRIGKIFIAITNPVDAVYKVEDAVKQKLNTYICVSNPRTVVYANKHSDYCEVMNNSYMNVPDAEPIIWAARLWGLKSVQRTMGPLLFSDLITNHQNGFRHFLLGDTEETLLSLSKKIKEENGSIVVGIHSPPFCDLDNYNYQEIANLINESEANIVWLSLRAPKQDFFAVRLLPFLKNKVCIGVGASFRFHLGEHKMAPRFIKKLGLMGLYWGKKNQKTIPFLYGYLKDNIPYLLYLLQIIYRRTIGKKYYY